MLPQGEKRNYKLCFPLKTNEEGLYFDDEVMEVANNMTIFLSYQNIALFYKNCSKNMLLIDV